MFSPAEIALWGPEDALHELKERIPLGWRLTIRTEDRSVVAELHDENGIRAWVGANTDPKLLFLDGLGWLITRNHKTHHPAWRPRAREMPLCVPNKEYDEPLPPDLDPDEVAAVYRNRR